MNRTDGENPNSKEENVLSSDTTTPLMSMSSSNVETLKLENEEYCVNHLDNCHVTDQPDVVDLNSEDSVCGHSYDDNERSRTPRSVIIKDLPHQLFKSQELKNKLEKIITQNGRINGAKFYYLTLFKRCRVDFDNAEDAVSVRKLCSEIYLGQDMSIARTYLMEPLHLRIIKKNNNQLKLHEPHEDATIEPHLKPPKPERAFLISPPSSPPVGWCQAVEPPPIVDRHELMLALQALQSQECVGSRELLPATECTPQIIVHPCSNCEQIAMIEQLKPVPTRRPY